MQGVAQWGCLGQGSTQWAAVAGFENVVMPEGDNIDATNQNCHHHSPSQSSRHIQSGSSPSFDDIYRRVDQYNPVESSIPSNSHANQSIHSLPTSIGSIHKSSLEKTPPLSNRRSSRQDMKDIELEILPKQLKPSFIFDRPDSSLDLESFRHGKQHSGIFVRKRHGGGIYVDDPGFLALWSVQAISLVRRHLHRAGNGLITLPCQFNWTNENPENDGELIVEAVADEELPNWAGKTSHNGTTSIINNRDESDPLFRHGNMQTHVTITDLPAMVDEVQELLDIMLDVVNVQKRRRLKKLQAPSWIRCNWYIIAALATSTLFFARNFDVKIFLKRCLGGIKSFYQERLRDPLMAM
jgi:hypothetical protein